VTEPVDSVLKKLATRLRLDRPLTFLDLESTGPFAETDRIVEIAAITLHPEGRVVRFQTLVNPEAPIPAAATSIHGIGDADVASAPTFRQLAPKIFKSLNGRDVAGYNLRRYDLRMLASEFARVNIVYDVDQVRVVDVMRIYHLNEKRDLEAAVKLYLGRTHTGHRAGADIEATISVLASQLDRYELPSDVGELDEYCRNQPPDWLTRDGRIAWRDGMPRVTFGRHAGKSLQTLASEAPEYLSWMLENEFASDVEKIVQDALDGRFPTEPNAQKR